MTWTHVVIEVDVDGTIEATQDLRPWMAETLLDDDRIIALSVHAESEHADDCDNDPCVCEKPGFPLPVEGQ